MVTAVDDRAFVVGLCELARQRMAAFEAGTMLPLAERACAALRLAPAEGPVEGYYTDSAALERLFRLVRALQRAPMPEVAPADNGAIEQLRRVLASPAMGRPVPDERVLPRTTSPFGQALSESSAWSIDGLCRAAERLVRPDDAGLVAVASAAADPVALCVARETAALSADVELAEVEPRRFVWQVSHGVTAVAARYVRALREATGIDLPEPGPASADVYGEAAADAELAGRCILIGERQPAASHRFYHWYIAVQDGTPVVRDFWSSQVWTTAMMREVPVRHRPARGARVGDGEGGGRGG